MKFNYLGKECYFDLFEFSLDIGGNKMFFNKNYTVPQKYAYLKLNNNCNLKCVYCFQKTEEKSNTNLSMADYLWLKSLKKFDRVILFGGEPFITKNIENVKFLFSELENKKISIFTNGCFSDWYANFITENKDQIDEIIITIDGPESYHNSRRVLKNDNSYKKIISNVLSINKADKNVIIQVNLDEDNISQVGLLLTDLQKQLPLQMHKNIVLLNPVLHENNLVSEIELLKLYVRLKKENPRINLLVNSKVYRKLTSLISNKGLDSSRCNVGNVYVYDFTNNLIYTCPESNETIIGEFCKKNYNVFVNKVKHYDDYANKRNENCVKCEYRCFCKYGCIVDNDIGKFGCKEEVSIEIQYILDNFGYFYRLDLHNIKKLGGE